MEYVSLDYCKTKVFPYIYARLSKDEPSAQYDQEANGLQELEKVLHLMESDMFYPTFPDKAAYLLCSIAGSQYFSNGNKRLGVMTLMSFLVLNHVKLVTLSAKKYQSLLRHKFPKHNWENNTTIVKSHALFLYNLAIIIGDRTVWEDGVDFDVLKKKVSEMFSELYHLPKV